MTTYGGEVDFQYDHATYWPALNQLADERRAAYRERWIRGGKRVGELESYLKGGNVKSLAESEGVIPASSQPQMNGQVVEQMNGVAQPGLMQEPGLIQQPGLVQEPGLRVQQ